MKLGMHNVFASKDWEVDFLDMLPRMAKAGFDFVELNPVTCLGMTPTQRQDVMKCAEDNGMILEFSCGLAAEYDMASTDEAVRKHAVEFVRKLLTVSHEMGGHLFAGGIYAAWPFRPTGPFDKTAMWDAAVRSCKEVMDLCEEWDIDFACEVLNRFEHVLLNTVEEGLRFIDEIESPKACLTVDTFHMNIEEDSICDALRLAKGRIGDVHFGENNRRFPGQGGMPWVDIIKTLKEIGYDGYIMFEPFVIPGGTVARDVSLWHPLQEDVSRDHMYDLAKASCGFIRNIIELA